MMGELDQFPHENMKWRLLQAIRKAAWRSEISLCREFASRISSPAVEDALYSLVMEKKIEWFGDNNRPLRYRAFGVKGTR
jgi:hypothetical protein